MARGCTAARQKHRIVLPPPGPVGSFENRYGVGWCWAGTGWLKGTSGFTVMATASYIWGILTLAFVQLLWRGDECHHKQFQWLPLSPACVRRDKGSSQFFLLDVCPFLLNFFSFFPSDSPQVVCCLSAIYVFCSSGTRMQLKSVLWAVQVGHVA